MLAEPLQDRLGAFRRWTGETARAYRKRAHG